MPEPAFTVIEKIYHAEVSKVDSKNHSFSIQFYGFSTAGGKRRVRVHLEPWLFQYFAAALVEIPKEIHKIADDMQKALHE